MLDKFSKYVPAISPLAVAAPANEGRSATSREVAGRKRYLRLSCGWLVAVAVLAISPIAHADPVHMACSGGMLLPNRKVDTNSVLSLTIDLRAGAVTVGGLPTGGNPSSIPSIAKVRDSGYGKQRGVLVWALSRRRFIRRQVGASFFLCQFLCSI